MKGSKRTRPFFSFTATFFFSHSLHDSYEISTFDLSSVKLTGPWPQALCWTSSSSQLQVEFICPSSFLDQLGSALLSHA